MIALLPDENPIASLDRQKIVLTNQRLVVSVQNHDRTIILDQISSIELEIKYKLTVIIIAGIALVLGIIQGKALVGVGILCFLVLIGVYLFFPKKKIVIATPDGLIAVDVSRLENSELTQFVFRVRKKTYLLKH